MVCSSNVMRVERGPKVGFRSREWKHARRGEVGCGKTQWLFRLKEIQDARLTINGNLEKEHARWRCAPQTTTGLHVRGRSAESVQRSKVVLQYGLLFGKLVARLLNRERLKDSALDVESGLLEAQQLAILCSRQLSNVAACS